MSAHEESNEIAAFLDDLGDRLADMDVDNLTEQEIRSWLDEIKHARIRIDDLKSKWGGDRWRTYVAPRWPPISVKEADLESRLDQIGRRPWHKDPGRISKMILIGVVFPLIVLLIWKTLG